MLIKLGANSEGWNLTQEDENAVLSITDGVSLRRLNCCTGGESIPFLQAVCKQSEAGKPAGFWAQANRREVAEHFNEMLKAAKDWPDLYWMVD